MAHYSSQIYDSRLVSVQDFMVGRLDKTHRQLYLDALDKYIDEWLEIRRLQTTKDHLTEKEQSFLLYHKDDKMYTIGDRKFEVDDKADFLRLANFIEIMPDEYWQPSHVMITTKFRSKKSPSLRWKVDLAPYWNDYQNKARVMKKPKMSVTETMADLTLTKIDYVRGTCTCESEMLDRKMNMPMDQVDGNDILVDEDMTLKNTFLGSRYKTWDS